MIPVVLCIDVEPDPRMVDRDDPPAWAGFERSLERLPALRNALEEATGAPVAFAWYVRMDSQVEEAWGSAAWAAETYADDFRKLLDQGDEVGLHAHPYRWDAASGEWVTDFEDKGWAEHCLHLGLDAFESGFGQPCTTHRGGDHFLSGGLLRVLAERGVTTDLTVEPGLPPDWQMIPTETTIGIGPDYRRVPTGPYRSSPERFPAADPAAASAPLLIPLTSARRRRPPFRRWTLSIELEPRVFAQRLALELRFGAHSVLAFGSRTDAALGSRWDWMEANLMRLAQEDGARFVTASAAAELVE
jgi:hypothetical protein